MNFQLMPFLLLLTSMGNIIDPVCKWGRYDIYLPNGGIKKYGIGMDCFPIG